MKKITSFHKTCFGTFGEHFRCDLDGYVHTTALGWMNAPMGDWKGYSRDEKYERCKELATEAREAVKESEAALAEWRKSL